MEENPIQASIEYLMDCGWTNQEAKNLIRAVQDTDAERLWESAPMWIEHCGACMQYVKGLMGTVALGLANVRRGEDGEWLVSLSEKGLALGKQMTARGEA